MAGKVFVYYWIFFQLATMFNVLSFSEEESNPTPKTNITATERLRKDLLADYHAAAEAKSVPAKVSLIINRVNLNYKDSLFVINGWLIQEWLDPKLKWNVSKYENVDKVHMSSYEIWRPDIIAHDSASGYTSTYDDSNYLVNSTGGVFWMPSVTYKVYCKLDIVEWPFDTQNCSLHLCPQSYDNNDLILSINPNRPYLVQNVTGNWKILDGYSITRDVERTSSFSDSVPVYTSVIYVFKIRKNHAVYHTFVTLPAFGILTLLLSAFWLLPEEIERLLLTGLVSTISGIFLFFFAVKVPLLLYETPNIIKYYGWMLCLSLFYTILTVILYNLSNRLSVTKISPPASCTKFLNFCGRTVFFLSFKRISPAVYDDLGDTEAIPVDNEDAEEGTSSSWASKGKSADSSNKIQQRWKIIATAIDNICFVFYVIFGVTAFFVWV